jgi:hypothetical protein
MKKDYIISLFENKTHKIPFEDLPPEAEIKILGIVLR